MWQRTENSELIRPLDVEESGNNVILRKNFVEVQATEDKSAHYEYDEWQMTKEQYEVYEIVSRQANAIEELSEKVDGELSEAIDVIDIMTGGAE